MKDVKKIINPLADISAKAGKICFIHSDGKEHFFYSCVNEMTGCRMSVFDNEAPSVDDTLSWVKSVFRDIRKKATVISVEGDF